MSSPRYDLKNDPVLQEFIRHDKKEGFTPEAISEFEREREELFSQAIKAQEESWRNRNFIFERDTRASIIKAAQLGDRRALAALARAYMSGAWWSNSGNHKYFEEEGPDNDLKAAIYYRY